MRDQAAEKTMDQMKLRIELHRCRPWIEAALNNSARSHTFDNVVELVLKGDAHLWSSANGCMVTLFVEYPLSRTCHIWLLGGDFEQVYTDHAEALDKWAKENRCDQIVVNGRKGWERKLKDRGYDFKAVILIKEI